MSDDCTSKFATSSAAGFGFGSLIGALNATWQVRIAKKRSLGR